MQRPRPYNQTLYLGPTIAVVFYFKMTFSAEYCQKDVMRKKYILTFEEALSQNN